MLKGPGLIFSDPYLSVIKCNCQTFNDIISAKFKKTSFEAFFGSIFFFLPHQSYNKPQVNILLSLIYKPQKSLSFQNPTVRFKVERFYRCYIYRAYSIFNLFGYFRPFSNVFLNILNAPLSSLFWKTEIFKTGLFQHPSQ